MIESIRSLQEIANRLGDGRVSVYRVVEQTTASSEPLR
jgi:hypothetical protein